MADRNQPGYSLALGAGGARALAHIGVLAVLDDAGLAPRAIAGTSMGAFVGAMYAAGADPDEMTAGVEGLELRQLAALPTLTLKPGSIMTADRIEAQLRRVLPPTFADLRIPLACVATDLVTGAAVVVSQGDLPRAVRASMTIPILFDPVPDDGRLLVDGGIVDPVPVRVARSLGGAPVVAVDVGSLSPVEAGEGTERGLGPMMESGKAPTVVQVGTRTLDVMSHWLAVPQYDDASVVITPDVGGYFFADVMEGPAIVAEGRDAARTALPAIREAVEDSALTPAQRWWRRMTRA